MTRNFPASTNAFPTTYDFVVTGSQFNDTLFGGVGNNYMDGNGGYDVLSYASLNQAISLGARGVVNKGIAGVDQAAEVEAIVAPEGYYNVIDGSTAGTAAALNVNLANNSLKVEFPSGAFLKFDVYNFMDVVGTSQNDTITGNYQSNILLGGAGNDYIGGSGGFDTLSGGSGYDVLDYSGLNQTLVFKAEGIADKGTAGIDQVTEIEAIVAPEDYYNVIDGSNLGFAALDVNLSANSSKVVTSMGVASKVDVYNFVDVVGSSYNDTLIGNAESNILQGGAGSDYIAGVAGFDTLVGGTGQDIFALGDSLNVNYLGSDFATIVDWNPFEDFISLTSTFPNLYSLGTGNVSGSLTLDTLIYYGNDLLAVLQDSTSISSSNFLFV